MKITIESECRRGLRIIEEIPDIALCKIEGYNGIGKTNAIRLLRLCAGEQPFRGNESSWRTFRNQLVRARVRVTNLRGAESVEWLIEPHLWPDVPDTIGETFAAVRISDRSARMSDVAPLFQVHHFLVTETPTSVLSGRFQDASDTVTRWLNTKGVGRSAELDERLKALLDEVARCSPGRLQQEIGHAQKAEETANDASNQLARARERINLLESAVETADRLDQVKGRGPEMDERIAELQNTLDELDSRKQELDELIADASSKEHRNQEAEHEFDKAQKHLIRRDKELREARSVLERLSAAAGVSADHDQIDRERSLVGQRLNQLVDELPQVHATPILIAALNEIAETLREAEAQELGEAVLIEKTRVRAGWTVTELRETCLSQADEFSSRMPTSDEQRITAQINKARERLDILSQAARALTDLQEAQRRLASAEARLRDAANSLPTQAAQTLDDLIEARNKLDEEGRVIQADHARLSYTRDLLGGGMTEEALTAQLERLCRDVGVDASRVRGAYERERVSLEELIRREAQASQQADRARRIANEATVDFAAIVQRVSEDPELAWLRRAIPEVRSVMELGLDDQAKLLGKIINKVESARDELQKNVSAVQGIGSALGHLAKELHRSDVMAPDDNPWNLAARMWLAEEVGRWFGDEMIVSALFDDGSDITLDPLRLVISWMAEGEPQERSLDAFSSGQQAFAYTRARVAQLDREQGDAENRLVALDEFSSLIDARLMTEFAKYLNARQVQAERDQVVVVLPLESLPGTDSETDKRRTRELERRGYFAEHFQS